MVIGVSSSLIVMHLGCSKQVASNYTLFLQRVSCRLTRYYGFQNLRPAIVVEIDESKFGRRKFHRGHRVDGVWIFDRVERNFEQKLFLFEV